MKKERLLMSFLVFLIGSFCFNASAYSEDELVSIARKASLQAAKKMSTNVSPGTYQDPDYNIDYDSFKFDSDAQQLEFQATLRWSAKDRMILGTRRLCEIWGKMCVDLLNGKDEIKVKFIPSGINDWCEECAKSHNLDILAEALIFTVNR